MKRKLLFCALLTCLSFNAQAKTVFATVNNENITIKDIDRMLNSLEDQRAFSQLKEDERQLLLNQVIENKLVLQHAKAEKIQNHPLYKEALKNFQNKMMVEVWMKKEFDAVQVSSEELQTYYNDHLQEFKQQEEIKARHIVVKTEQEAQKIIEQLKQNKKDTQKYFIQLAKEHSIGPSAPKGGDLGWFKKGTMLESFWQEAKSLKSNTFSSKPIQTQYGYHIIYVDGKQQAYTIAFEEIVDVIKDKVKMQKFQSQIASTILKLKQKADIQLHH